MGFEIIVRPAVLPNIRPAPSRSLSPQDDPEKGFAVITGNGAQRGSQSYSFSVSVSQTRPVETERRIDMARVYQKTPEGGGGDGGRINRKNYVDVEVANRVKMRGGGGFKDEGDYTGKPPIVPWYFARPRTADNIEIMERDIIRKNPDEAGTE